MTVVDAHAQGRGPATHDPQIALVDLLDRLLGTGVVLAGDVVISLAGVDLVQVKLHALISSVRAEMASPQRSHVQPAQQVQQGEAESRDER